MGWICRAGTRGSGSGVHTWAVGVSFAASVCNVCAKVHRTRPHQEPTLRQDGGHGHYSNTSGERNADGYDYYKLVDESAETSAWQPNVLVRTRWSLSDVERGNGWTETASRSRPVPGGVHNIAPFHCSTGIVRFGRHLYECT
jgi:hypothetical protein